MVVEQLNLGWGDTGVLEFLGGALFASENDDRGALDSDGACACGGWLVMSEEEVMAVLDGAGRCWCTSLHGLAGIFYLEDVAIRTEDCDRVSMVSKLALCIPVQGPQWCPSDVRCRLTR